MHGEIAATRDGKILGVRVKVLADHGAFNGTAQPTKFPAGFFHVFTGSYDLQAAHCEVTGVYTNKAPGGVAYACSFRITEAVVPGRADRRRAGRRAGDGPGRAADEEPAAARAVPVHMPDRLGVRLGRLPAGAAAGHGHGRLRRAARSEQAEKRAARRADGHRRQLLHRGRRRRPAQAHGHPRPRHGRRRRAAGAPDRQGGAAASRCRPRARATRRRSRRSSAEELGIPPDDIEVVHGDTDQTPFGLGTYGSRSTPVSGARDRGGRPQGARAGEDRRRRRCSRSAPDDLEWEKGRWFVTRRPGAGQDDPGDRARGALQPGAAGGRRGPPGRDRRLQPAEPDLPVRRLHLRRRRRPGHRRRSRCGGSSRWTTAACGSTR